MAEEFVMVPVPRNRVLEVYALLAAPPGARGPAGAEATPDDERDLWDAALVERAYRESSDAMRGVLDHLADHPGQRILSADLGQVVGYSRPQLAGVFGAFGRRWNNRYKNPGKWFIKAEWSGAADQWEWWMEPEVAEIINRIRGK